MNWPAAIKYLCFIGLAQVLIVEVKAPRLVVPSSIIAAICFVTLIILRTRNVILTARKNKREHNIRWGMCAQCGYNLRGSTTICPECGTPIPELPWPTK